MGAESSIPQPPIAETSTQTEPQISDLAISRLVGFPPIFVPGFLRQRLLEVGTELKVLRNGKVEKGVVTKTGLRIANGDGEEEILAKDLDIDDRKNRINVIRPGFGAALARIFVDSRLTKRITLSEAIAMGAGLT